MRLKCFLARLARWQEVFAQERTPRRAVALTLGLVCGLGRRTMTRALCFLGWQDRDWATNYRVFSRSPWSSAELFTPVMEAAIRDWLPAHGPIAVALDDTGVPRTGKKIKTAGWQRDPMSPPFHVNLRWGLRFVQASVLLPLYRRDPAQSTRAVPVRFAECPVVRRPKKDAGDDERAAWRKARKTPNLSTRFVAFEYNHRDEKDILGVGQAQVRADKSVPRQPELVVAAYGPGRTTDYVSLPKWRRRARRPSCQDLVNLLRQQVDAAARAGAAPGSDFAQMVVRAAG